MGSRMLRSISLFSQIERVIYNVCNYRFLRILCHKNATFPCFSNSTCSFGTFQLNKMRSSNICHKLCTKSDCNMKCLQDFHRSYSKKRKAELDSDSSDEEELNDILDKYDRNSKIIKSNVSSLRTDLLLKSALGLARNKVDLAFYESRVRVNGEKIFKKSHRVNVGDEIDVIKGVNNVNPDILNVARVEIISVKPDEDEICVKMRRFKALQIENYENAPYFQADS